MDDHEVAARWLEITDQWETCFGLIDKETLAGRVTGNSNLSDTTERLCYGDCFGLNNIIVVIGRRETY